MKLSQIRNLYRAVKDGDDIATNNSEERKLIARFNPAYQMCDCCYTVSLNITTVGSTEYCPSCYDDNVGACDYCGDATAYEDLVRVGNDSYCDSCVESRTFECTACGERQDDSSLSMSDDYHSIGECCADHYTACQDCNAVIPTDNATYTEDGEPFCECCAPEHIINRRGLNGYGSKAEDCLTWGKPQRKSLYMGMELEVQISDDYDFDDVLSDLVSNLPLLPCEDGSLDKDNGYHGAELKSAPQSLSQLKSLTETLIGQIPYKGSVRSHNGGSCGLHIHLSRKGLTPMQEARIWAFINDLRNQELITKVARRYDVPYAKRMPHAYMTDRARSRYLNSDRRSMVNFTDETLELRLFRGTLKLTSLHTSLEFAAALVDFTKTGIHVYPMDTEGFTRFITETPYAKKEFPNLYKMLAPVQSLYVDTSTDAQVLKLWATIVESAQNPDPVAYWPELMSILHRLEQPISAPEYRYKKERLLSHPCVNVLYTLQAYRESPREYLPHLVFISDYRLPILNAKRDEIIALANLTPNPLYDLRLFRAIATFLIYKQGEALCV